MNLKWIPSCSIYWPLYNVSIKSRGADDERGIVCSQKKKKAAKVIDSFHTGSWKPYQKIKIKKFKYQSSSSPPQQKPRAKLTKTYSYESWKEYPQHAAHNYTTLRGVGLTSTQEYFKSSEIINILSSLTESAALFGANESWVLPKNGMIKFLRVCAWCLKKSCHRWPNRRVLW